MTARRGASAAHRIVLNRAAFDEITLASADGAFELAKAIVSGARVPDAPQIGQGLVEGGGVIAFVGNKRVGAWTKSGESPKKPRAAKLSSGVTVIAGFGFPARFNEEGTIHMPAHPFLTPAVAETLPDAGAFLKEAAVKHGIISTARRQAGDVYGGTMKTGGRALVSRTRSALRRVGSGGGVS